MWHEIGRQFRNPSGVGGRVMGRVMRVINRRPNHLAIRKLEIEPDDTVLDVGCGPGAAVKEMSRLANRGVVHGVDQSSTMLRQAERENRSAILSGRVALHAGRFDCIPLADGAVDKILAVNVVYFWTDTAKVLAELRRVLRPRGLISIYATDASAMKKWKFAGNETHRLFDAEALVAAFRCGPFADCDVTVTSVRVSAGVPGLVALVGPRRQVPARRSCAN